MAVQTGPDPLHSAYGAQLDALWARLAAAATERPALQALWARDSDPRVARLVQAAGYLFGRVRAKLEDDVPELSHAIVAASLPEVLRPFPAATVIAFSDDRRARRLPSEQPEGSRIESRPIDGAPCSFRTAWATRLAPVLVSGNVRAREPGATLATLTLTAYPKCPLALAIPGSLRVFVRTAEPIAALDVVRGICVGEEPVSVRVLDAEGRELTTRKMPRAARCTALGAEPLVFGAPHDRFSSGTLLRAFFAFPELFAFFDLEGLAGMLSGLDSRARTLELSVRLSGEVQDGAFDATFHADCVPAANVFEARTIPIPVHGLGPLGALGVSGPAGREILHVQRMSLVSTLDPNRPLPIALWDRDLGQPLSDGGLYARLERSPDRIGVELVRPNGAAGVPHGQLVAEVLATDGDRTASLPGDLGANLTRVTAMRRPALASRLPWRVNALARIPCARFQTAPTLAGYLDLHDTLLERDAASPPKARGVLGVTRHRISRVLGGEVRHGEQVDIELDEHAFGGPGATWLVGELLARALAERTDLLRVTRARLIAGGSVLTDYGYRDGERLPSPFG